MFRLLPLLVIALLAVLFSPLAHAGGFGNLRAELAVGRAANLNARANFRSNQALIAAQTAALQQQFVGTAYLQNQALVSGYVQAERLVAAPVVAPQVYAAPLVAPVVAAPQQVYAAPVVAPVVQQVYAAPVVAPVVQQVYAAPVVAAPVKLKQRSCH